MIKTTLLRALATGILATAVPAISHAQIALPPVQVPVLQTPIDLNRTVNGVLDVTSAEQLRELKRLRVRELLRTNRTVLEADPRGAPVVRSEVVALSPTPAALELARTAGFEIARTRTLEGLDASIVVLRAPPQMSTRRALRELQRADPEGVYDFNHLYFGSGETAASPSSRSDGNESVALVPSARVGLIDGGVDRAHAVFSHNEIHEHGCETAMPSEHGTAVASLIAGYAPDFQGAAPGAALYVADVYCGAATGGAVDAVADAFAWLSREGVPVINVSLVGPANRMLEQIVRIVIARGNLIVAAVGNDGPSASALYPAAYPGVVAVTAVDAKRRVLLEACRGSHVGFAAPGADMQAATLQQAYAPIRGTSFAAPLVAGLLALELQQSGSANVAGAIASLATRAIDLGARGEDKIYGKGLVGETLRKPQEPVRLGGVE